MARSRLLQAVCTVALLAAVPAFAQQNMAPAQGATGDSTPTTSAGAGAADQGGAPQGDHSTAPSGHGMGAHGAAMSHPHHAMRGNATDASQDSVVDQLNEQSLRAAQEGRTFNAANDTGGASGSMSGASSAAPSGAPPSGAAPSGSDMSGGSAGGSAGAGTGAAGH